MKKLQEDLYTLKTIFEASPFPIYLCTGENLIIALANEATLKSWGRTKDVIGKPIQEAVPEIENQPFKDLLLEVLHTGIPYSSVDQKAELLVEGRLQTYYFKFSYQAFKNQKGEITGVFCVANDVTELVVARQERAESEQSARLAIEATQLGTFDLNLLNGSLSWDSRCRNLFGVTPDQPVNYTHDFLTKLHPDDRERINDIIYKQAFVKDKSDGDYDEEFRIIATTPNKLRWVKSKGKVLFDKKDVPIRFIGTVLDITDSKQADEKNAILSAIIQFSNDAIISKNLDGIVNSWNGGAERMFGYSADEMIGQSIFKIIPPDHFEEEKQILARLKRGELVEHFETKRIRKDNKIIHISLTISPIKDNQGHTIGLSKIARDITDQKMAEIRKNDFITIASHELKTPLTTIKSYLQLLLTKDRMVADGLRLDALIRMEKQANKMFTLIQNFIDTAKLVERKFDLDVQSFNIHELLTEVVSDAKILSPSHEIVLNDYKDVFVLADRNKISQVMENLIGNAVKYSSMGSTIYISSKLVDADVEISVSDSGVGIGFEDQNKVFDQFYRVKNENMKNASGFGIGLYLVAEILNLHNSKIKVESKEGVGSNFYFKLPTSADV